MTESRSLRVPPGSPPVSTVPGRVTVTIESMNGDEVEIDVQGGPQRAQAHPLGPGRWSIDLAAGSSGRLAVRPVRGDVFGSGSALIVMIDMPGTRVNVYPAPDVSGLRTPTLVTWAPDTGSLGGAPLLDLRVIDVDRSSGTVPVNPGPGSGPDPVAAAPQPNVEVLGPVAQQARNIAREIVGGPIVDPPRQRAVDLVIDASTSMRRLEADPRLADVVGVVLGAGNVIGPDQPTIHLTSSSAEASRPGRGGRSLTQVDAPDAVVTTWFPTVFAPDSFGMSLEAVRQGLSSSRRRRVVVVVTDDVPADISTLSERLRATGADELWQVIVVDLDPPRTYEVDLRDVPSSGPVRVLRLPASLWHLDGTLDPGQLRLVVAALVDEQVS